MVRKLNLVFMQISMILYQICKLLHVTGHADFKLLCTILHELLMIHNPTLKIRGTTLHGNNVKQLSQHFCCPRSLYQNLQKVHFFQLLYEI
jgi:hypothetical protein